MHTDPTLGNRHFDVSVTWTFAGSFACLPRSHHGRADVDLTDGGGESLYERLKFRGLLLHLKHISVRDGWFSEGWLVSLG